MKNRPLARLWGYLFANPDPARRLRRRLELHPLEAREVPAGDFFQLGTAGTFTAPATGTLRLVFNDDYFPDNAGGYTVTWAGATYAVGGLGAADGPAVVAGQTYAYTATGAIDIFGTGAVFFDPDGINSTTGTTDGPAGPGFAAPGLTRYSLVAVANAAPDATDDEAETDTGTAVAVDVLANDTDPVGDALTLLGVGTAGHGTVAVVDGQAVYTPAAGYTGTDTFTYTVSDGHGGTATGTVNVTLVNRPPVAADDVATTEVDAAPITINVLANDTDPDGHTLTLLSVGTPDHGTASIVNGQVLYTPDPDYVGTATFTYTVSDGHGGTSTATVTVNVEPESAEIYDDTGVADQDGETVNFILQGPLPPPDAPPGATAPTIMVGTARITATGVTTVTFPNVTVPTEVNGQVVNQTLNLIVVASAGGTFTVKVQPVQGGVRPWITIGEIQWAVGGSVANTANMIIKYLPR